MNNTIFEPRISGPRWICGECGLSYLDHHGADNCCSPDPVHCAVCAPAVMIPRCGSGHPIFTKTCTLPAGHSGYHGDGDISWADPATQRDGSVPLIPADKWDAAVRPTIPRTTTDPLTRDHVRGICYFLGVEPGDTDRIVITADVVTVYGRPGTVPLVVPVVGA